MELTQQQLEALVEMAESGNPQAIAMLNFVMTGSVTSAPLNPGQGLSDYPAVDKNGMFDINDQMIAAGKYRSDTVDRASNVNAGSGAWAPGTFDANPTWEPLQTPIRDNMERYLGESGIPTTWKGVMAEVLLGGGTDDEAVDVAKAAVANGMPGPQEMVAGTGINEGKMIPVDPHISFTNFATRNFEKLATEPNVNGPNVRPRQDGTGGYEIKTDEGLSETAQWYRDQGIPLPTEQYDMQWLEGTPGGAAMIQQNAQQLSDAEAAFKAAQSTPEGMNQFGEYTDPEMRARQQQALAQANYALNRPNVAGTPTAPNAPTAPSNRSDSPAQQVASWLGSSQSNVPNVAPGKSPSPIQQLGAMLGISGRKPTKGKIGSLDPQGKRNDAMTARFQAMEDFYGPRTSSGGKKAPRREVKYRETKDQRDNQFNSMVARNQAIMDRNTMEGDLRRLKKQGRTPTGDVMEERQRAMLRELGLTY